MTLVLGIDPGHGGAFAVYDSVSKRVISIDDMPVWYQAIGRSLKRPRIDALAVAELFDVYELMGVELVVLESVGGRPRQAANAAFTFGYGVGIIYMAALYSRMPIETVLPQTWKKHMAVPGKGKGPGKTDGQAIAYRADEIFPNDRDKWRGDRGGFKVDRAEAAMLARYGAEFIIERLGPVDKERLFAHSKEADTGA